MNPVSPAVVALVRGLILAIGTAAVGAIALFASDNSDTLHRYWWGPLVLVGVRWLEGVIDKFRGQAPQAGIGGSKPANPADYYAGTTASLTIGNAGQFTVGTGQTPAND